jgi:anti-anti-sigma regulatory factor
MKRPLCTCIVARCGLEQALWTGDVDHFRQAEAAALSTGLPLILDLTHTRLIDGACLGQLASAWIKLGRDPLRFAISNCGPDCARILRISGLDRSFEFHQDLASALDRMAH